MTFCDGRFYIPNMNSISMELYQTYTPVLHGILMRGIENFKNYSN